MRLTFLKSKPELTWKMPERTEIPAIEEIAIAARYQGARVGGDFYDVLAAGHGRVLMLLMDVAGERRQALHLAAHAQECFRQRGPELFGNPEVNEAEGLSELALGINRAIIDAAQTKHFSPAFLACYSQKLGTIFYINAGHTPGFVMEDGRVDLLEATGLPLGLFTHTIHDAQMCVLGEGDALVLASRGVVECGGNGRNHEFGIEGIEKTLAANRGHSAEEVCGAVLREAQACLKGKAAENDMTVVVVKREGSRESRVARHGM